MEIAPEIARLLAGPLMMTLGTRDAADRPMIGRASGAFASGDRSLVHVLISGWLWPETIENLRENGMLALTVVHPGDYRAYQMKGRAALRPATEAEQARAARYVAAARATLIGLGVPEPMTGWWLCDRAVAVAELTVAQVYEQTPGPRAGTLLA